MSIHARAKGRKVINQEDHLSFDHADIRSADYSGRKVKSFVAIGSRFTSCRFEKMKIEQACFGAGNKDSYYVECTFDGSRITAVAPGHARFVRCSFRNVTLRSFFCRSVEFIDCVFSGSIKNAFFNGSVPQEDRSALGRAVNEFAGNDFSEADLIDVGFRTGINLADQKLPTQSGYLLLLEASLATANAWNEVSKWQHSKLKQDALAILTAIRLELEQGQDHLLLRSDTFSTSQREAADAVVSLLRSSVK